MDKQQIPQIPPIDYSFTCNDPYAIGVDTMDDMDQPSNQMPIAPKLASTSKAKISKVPPVRPSRTAIKTSPVLIAVKNSKGKSAVKTQPKGTVHATNTIKHVTPSQPKNGAKGGAKMGLATKPNGNPPPKPKINGQGIVTKAITTGTPSKGATKSSGSPSAKLKTISPVLAAKTRKAASVKVSAPKTKAVDHAKKTKKPTTSTAKVPAAKHRQIEVPTQGDEELSSYVAEVTISTTMGVVEILKQGETEQPIIVEDNLFNVGPTDEMLDAEEANESPQRMERPQAAKGAMKSSKKGSACLDRIVAPPKSKASKPDVAIELSPIASRYFQWLAGK